MAATIPSCKVKGTAEKAEGTVTSRPSTPAPAGGGSSLGVCVSVFLLLPNASLPNSYSWIYSSPLAECQEAVAEDRSLLFPTCTSCVLCQGRDHVPVNRCETNESKWVKGDNFTRKKTAASQHLDGKGLWQHAAQVLPPHLSVLPYFDVTENYCARKSPAHLSSYS